jgi:predicted nucleic acid-binding protein
VAPYLGDGSTYVDELRRADLQRQDELGAQHPRPMIVLDTTVLIDVLRGHRPAVDWLQSLAEVPACSELTRVEVIRGLRHRERTAAEPLVRAIRWMPVDEEIARRAGALGRRWRRSHRLGTVDLVIAATAQELAATLGTSNVRPIRCFPT